MHTDHATTLVLPMNTRLQEDWFTGFTPLGEGEDGDQRQWHRDSATLTWTRDACGLSTIVSLGSLQDVLARFPTMTRSEAATLIQSDVNSEALAGLRAAGLLQDPGLVKTVISRIADPDPATVDAAFQALADIAGSAIDSGQVSVGQALFSIPGWRHEKLQILRNFQMSSAASAHAPDCIATALQDADWEVRATGVLAAARLKIRKLAGVIASVRMPEGRRHGVTSRESRALLALRDAVTDRLTGSQTERVPSSIRAAVAGDSSGLDPEVAMLLHALTTPFHVGAAHPLNPHFQTDDTGQLRAPDGHPVAWVPPGSYVLGDAIGPAPFRATHLKRGFFIDCTWRGSADRSHATQAAMTFGKAHPIPVTLPTSDQLEIAARGPDGRRFPWGMNAEPQAWADLSPFGLRDLVGKTGEWLAGSDTLSSGGRKAPAAAQRIAAESTQNLGFRFAYG